MGRKDGDTETGGEVRRPSMAWGGGGDRTDGLTFMCCV